MANAAKEVRVSMKLLANVTDAKELAEYIEIIDKELKQAGGVHADALSKKLLDIRRALDSGDKSKDSVKNIASQVSALMPDIGKSKALGSIGALDQKLAKYGTAQAQVISKTLSDMKGAIESGNLSGETIEAMSKSLEKFVAEANKLPPEGLKKLGGEIRSVVGNTEELRSVISELNGIDYKVAVENPFLKLDITDAADNVSNSLAEIYDNIENFGEESGKQFLRIKQTATSALSGELSKKSIPAIKAIREEMTKLLKSLSGRELSAVGQKMKENIENCQNLENQLGRTGDAAVDNFDEAGGFVRAFNLQLDAGTEYVIGLARKIPIVGKAMAALPIGLILAGIAAIKKLIDGVLEKEREARKVARDIQIKTIESTLQDITKEYDLQNHLMQLQFDKENHLVALAKQRRDAEREVKKSILETQKAIELSTAKTDEQRESINTKYRKMFNELENEGETDTFNTSKEQLEKEIANFEKSLKLKKEKQDDLEKQRLSISTDVEEAKKKAKRGGVWDQIGTVATEASIGAGTGLAVGTAVPVVGNIAGAIVGGIGGLVSGMMDASKLSDQREESAEHAEELQKKYAAVNSGIDSLTMEIQKDEQKLEQMRDALSLKTDGMGDGLSKDERLIEERKKQQEAEENRVQLEKERKLAKEKHARDRERYLFDLETEEELRRYEQSRKQPWQNLNQQLKVAEDEELRYREREVEALKARNEVLKKIEDDVKNGKGVLEEDETRLSETTADLNKARSSRISFASTADSLRKQIHDRQFEEGMTAYSREREDADWQRSGRYGKANWAGKLRMDIERYREGKRIFDEAQAKIEADNNGTATLTPEQRRIVERNRDEGREKMTSTRDSIRSAAMEGDTQGMSFVAALFGHHNRLTRMGLGGDVANWDKETARNTKKLVEQNKELLKTVNNQAGGNFGWGL